MRRGRAESGEGVAPYSIERVYENIEAVLAAAKTETGSNAFLVGRSYGAICALGAAMRRPAPRVEWLPGQGHSAMREAPEMVARLIREFLSE
jgi:pimeloyl-ACP methyl ester carboxylesterase